MGPIAIELRLPEDQLQVLASLIVRHIGVDSGKDTYTASEAARRVGCSSKTIRRHVEAGLLPRVPNINRLLIPREAIDRMVGQKG